MAPFKTFLFLVPSLVNAAFLQLPSESKKLPNGLSVVMVQYPSPGTLAYQIAVRVGSRNEVLKGTTGFAHFFEHLMFRGTKNRSASEYGDLLMRLGAENNAWTATDLTVYHGMVSSARVGELLDAEADRFQNLSFDEKAYREEVGAVHGEYNKDSVSPEFQLEEKLMETAFTKHTYGHTTMGYKNDLLKFGEKFKEVWPFFEEHYRPENTTVILVGDVDFEKGGALVSKSFSPWKKPPPKPSAIPREPVQKAPRTADIKLTKQTQSRIVLAHKIPAFTPSSRESAAILLLSEIFFSTPSEFQKTYRYDKQWLDSIDASPGMPVDPGLWVINLRFSQAGESKKAEVLSAVQSLVTSIAAIPLSDEVVTKAKKRLKNAETLTWLGSSDALASQLALFTSFGDPLKAINQWTETVSSTSAKDISFFAQKYLVENNRTTISLEGAH